MNGLAEASIAQAQPMRDLDQVVQMLMQGVTPDELIQMGVPEQLVMAAMDELSKQMQVNQIPPKQEGLAGMQLQGM